MKSSLDADAAAATLFAPAASRSILSGRTRLIAAKCLVLLALCFGVAAAWGQGAGAGADPYSAVKDFGLDQAGLKMPDMEKAGDRLKAGGYVKDAILQLYESYHALPSLGEVGIEKYKSLLEKTEGREELIKSMNEGWDLIGKGLEAVETAQTMADLLGKGDNTEVIFRGTTKALSTFAGTEFGTQLLASFGVGGPVVQAAISAIEITWDSFKELRNETNARKLESLFYSLENDRKLFPKIASDCSAGGRVPAITSSREAVASVFDRVAGDGNFRSHFKAYVEEFMNASFPEPGTMDTLYNVLVLGSGRAQDQATQEAINANRAKIETWIQALIGQLRAEWRGRQAMCIERKTLKQVKEALGQGRSLLAALGELDAIVRRVPEIRKFADAAPGQITSALNSRNSAQIASIRGQAAEHAKSSVRYLPTVGPTGDARRELLAKLNTVWNAASEALKKLPDAAATAYAAAVQTNPIPPKETARLVPVNLNVPSIEQAQARLSGARTSQELEKAYAELTAEVDASWKKWNAEFDAANPLPSSAHQNYFVQRSAFTTAQGTKRDSLKASIDAYVGEVRSQITERRKVIAGLSAKLRELESATRMPTYNNMVNMPYLSGKTINSYAELGPALQQLAGGRRAVDAYLGLPKFAPPKWTGDEFPVIEYLRRIEERVSNERGARSNQVSSLQGDLSQLDVWERAVIAGQRRFAQEFEPLERTVKAEYVDSDLGEFLSRLNGRDKIFSSLASDLTRARAAATRLADEYRKEITSIEDDLAYLRTMQKRFEAFAATMKPLAPKTLGYYNGKPIVTAFDLSGRTPVRNKSEAEQHARNAVFTIENLGIYKFDDAYPTGIRGWIQGKIDAYLAAAGAVGPYGLFGSDVVFADDAQKIADAVKAIPKSSYGSNSYGKGIQNRTFAENLNKAVCGTGTLCFTSGHLGANISAVISSGEDNGTYPTKLDTLRSIAGSTSALRSAASDLLAALTAHLTAYNAQLVEEYRQIRAEAQKADECVRKPGIYRDGKCEELATTAGRPPGGSTPGTTPGSAPGPVAQGPQPPAGTPQRPGGPGAQSGPPGGTTPGRPGSAPDGAKEGLAAFQQQAETRDQFQRSLEAWNRCISANASNAASCGAPPANPDGLPPGPSAQPGPAGPGAGGTGSATGKSPGSAPPPGAGSPAGAPGAAPAMASRPSGVPAAAPSVSSASPAGPGQPGQMPQGAQGQPGGTPPPGMQAAAGAPGTPAQAGSPAGPGQPPAASVQRGALSGSPQPSGPSAPMAAAGAMPQQAGRPGAAAQGPQAMAMVSGSPQMGGPVGAPQQPDQSQAIRELYQRFAEAYQRKDVRGITKWLSPKWVSSSGSSAMDLEETLGNSFRVFDTIQFQIQGLQIQKASDTEYRVSYTALLTGRINRQNLKHEDKASVTDTVAITSDGPRITRTSGNNMWSKK